MSGMKPKGQQRVKAKVKATQGYSGGKEGLAWARQWPLHEQPAQRLP